MMRVASVTQPPASVMTRRRSGGSSAAAGATILNGGQFRTRLVTYARRSRQVYFGLSEY